MRRFFVAPLVAALTVASAAPPWPDQTDATPSVTNPSVPLSYVGNDASVSLGVNEDGHSEGQLMGVFARNNERAAVGQLWWDQSGAGGFQGDFNWLWGMNALEARQQPDQATVARLSFALDQNGDHDRKATVGFGIERRAFSIEAYLAGGVSGARRSDTSLANASQTINGADDIGAYTQVVTTTTESVFDRKPYGAEVGIQASHFFESTATRLHGGFGYQDGSGGARANTLSLGVDTPLGTRGWGLSGLAEHIKKSGSLDQDQSEDRIALYLRYEFGAHGSFVPTSQLEDPAWISRALARPSSAHPRDVESYRTRKSENVTTTRSPKQYANHFPIAQNDSASVTDGASVAIPVLANDSDPDGDALAISAVTPPAHGIATIAGTTIVYTPGATFTGTDTFRYTIGDGKGGVGERERHRDGGRRTEPRAASRRRQCEHDVRATGHDQRARQRQRSGRQRADHRERHAAGRRPRRDPRHDDRLHARAGFLGYDALHVHDRRRPRRHELGQRHGRRRRAAEPAAGRRERHGDDRVRHAGHDRRARERQRSRRRRADDRRRHGARARYGGDQRKRDRLHAASGLFGAGHASTTRSATAAAAPRPRASR